MHPLKLLPLVQSSSQANKQSPRRLLISQDRHEIYLSVATFDDEYVKYIQGRPTSKEPSLLIMQSYGPFPVADKSEMMQLGVYLLAFSCQGELK